MTFLLLLAGLVVLVLGAELLVRGASSPALAWGVVRAWPVFSGQGSVLDRPGGSLPSQPGASK